VVSLKEMNSEETATRLRSIFSLIDEAVSRKDNPIQALGFQKHEEDFQKMGKSIISEFRSFAGKTLESTMEAFINSVIS
jgi:hypothetical protein